MHLHHCRCFQEHVKMLLQNLRALSKAPGRAGSISKYFEALARATRVSGRFAYGLQTELHFADVWAECCTPLPKRWTPAPEVGPHQLELWKVASRDWIKNEYIIKEVPGPLILHATKIVHPYVSTDVFRDESLYTVLIQQQVSIYNQFWHYCPSSCLPHSFAAALWCYRCELKLNLHLRR
jgi:hypothetical protein